MLRPLGRGLRDTLDNLLPFTLLSFAWWLSALLIVTAPAGTLALFQATDPRALADHLRPTRAELLASVRRDLLRAWTLALAFTIPVLVLAINLRTWAPSGSDWSVLVPLWVVLLVLLVTAGGVAASLRAVHCQPTGMAIRNALVLTAGRVHRTVPVVLVLWIVVAIGGLLVIPALMFIPPLVAVTFNHLTYAALGIQIEDPLEPTPERLSEDERETGGKWSVG